MDHANVVLVIQIRATLILLVACLCLTAIPLVEADGGGGTTASAGNMCVAVDYTTVPPVYIYDCNVANSGP